MPFKNRELQRPCLVFTDGIRTKLFTMKCFMPNIWDIYMTRVLYSNITRKWVVWSIFSWSPAYFIIAPSGRSHSQCWISMKTNGECHTIDHSIHIIISWTSSLDMIKYTIRQLTKVTLICTIFRPYTGTYVQPSKNGHTERSLTPYAKSNPLNLTWTPFGPVTM